MAGDVPQGRATELGGDACLCNKQLFNITARHLVVSELTKFWAGTLADPEFALLH